VQLFGWLHWRRSFQMCWYVLIFNAIVLRADWTKHCGLAGLSPNSTCSICCGFVVQQAVQQIEQVEFGLKCCLVVCLFGHVVPVNSRELEYTWICIEPYCRHTFKVLRYDTCYTRNHTVLPATKRETYLLVLVCSRIASLPFGWYSLCLPMEGWPG